LRAHITKKNFNVNWAIPKILAKIVLNKKLKIVNFKIPKAFHHPRHCVSCDHPPLLFFGEGGFGLWSLLWRRGCIIVGINI